MNSQLALLTAYSRATCKPTPPSALVYVRIRSHHTRHDHSGRCKRASANTGSTHLAPHITDLGRTAVGGQDQTFLQTPNAVDLPPTYFYC